MTSHCVLQPGAPRSSESSRPAQGECSVSKRCSVFLRVHTPAVAALGGITLPEAHCVHQSPSEH
eukprot:13919326-Alexandrium_andersonii.AAC.1